MKNIRLCLVLAVCIAGALWGGGISAQERPTNAAVAQPDRPAAAAESSAPKAASDRPADREIKPLREQSIYIPYSKLRAVFEKEGRGVFLPYEKFQELW